MKPSLSKYFICSYTSFALILSGFWDIASHVFASHVCYVISCSEIVSGNVTRRLVHLSNCSYYDNIDKSLPPIERAHFEARCIFDIYHDEVWMRNEGWLLSALKSLEGFMF